jgi:hypothetical protein
MISKLKVFLKSCLGRLGYEITKRKPLCEHDQSDAPLANYQPFVLHNYNDENGVFDYQAYRDIQTAGNKDFINNTWVIKDNIDFLADYIITVIGQPRFGLCHGTRRGDEQHWFRNRLNCDVLGTDISDNASSFPNTIQWDFHDVKEEWIGNVDFIYTNALDHSYNPEKALDAWIKCLRPNGICIIEHSDMHSPKGATQLDPFGASIEIMPYLLSQWGKKSYYLLELMNAPAKNPSLDYLHFLVLRKR